MRENLRIYSIIMVIAGLVLALVSVKKGESRKALESTGVEVPGEVLNVDVVKKTGRRSGTYYYVTAKYTPKGQASITKQFEVTGGYFASITKGDEVVADTVPVVYAQSDPDDAIIRNGSTTEGGSPGAAKMMLIIAGVGGLGFLLSLLIGVGTKNKSAQPPPLPPLQ